MRVQRPCRHLSRDHLPHDFRKVFWLGVAARQQCRLALVELGIGEADRIPDDADQHIATAMPDEAEALLHGRAVAGRVDDDVKEVSVGDLGELAVGFLSCWDRLVRTERVRRKSETVCSRIHDGDMGASRLGEDDGCHSDGPRADDEDAILRCDVSAPDAMRTDREEFDHGRIIKRDVAGWHYVHSRYGEIFGHAAVLVHAQYADGPATIGQSLPAGGACPAGQIGDDVDRLPLRQRAAGRAGYDGARKLVSYDPGVFKVGMLALEDVEIGAANPHAADADQDLTISRLGFRAVHQREATRLLADHSLHWITPLNILVSLYDSLKRWRVKRLSRLSDPGEKGADAPFDLHRVI